MRRYTREVMEEAVKNNCSIAGICRYFDLRVCGGNHRSINQRIKEYEIDTSHFTGQGWSKGLTCETSESVRQFTKKRVIWTDEKVFVKNSGYGGSNLKERLLKLGWTYECKFCQINEWRGKEIRLQVDHINGDHTDHRLENLRFLCPNCHSQTETFGNKRTSPQEKKEKRQRTRRKYFCECGKDKLRRSKTCGDCATINKHNNTKIDWPDKETLKKMVWEKPTLLIAKDLEVSDVAIAKRCKKLGIEKPPRGYWMKNK